MANQQLFELQTYTPNSDVAAGFQPSQIIWARGGNDTFIGVQPNTATPGQLQIDTFIGDVAIDDPMFRQWSDTFILGDSTQSYYNNGNPFIFGVNDFAFITDFNPAQDFIQLHGTANDYQLVNVGLGEALVQQTEFGVDLIGFIFGNSDLSLENNYFQFKGYAPPEPVLPQIQQLGSSGFDITPTTATDPNGNVYMAGGTTGTLGEANNEESRDAIVAKYDSLGNLLWTRQLGTSSADSIYGIATDKQGNFYVAGFTEGDLATPKQAEGSDAWLAKYDSDGNQLWIEQFGEASISQAFSIDVDDDSNVYLSGITVKPAPELATDDLWVTKYDTNGNRQWFTEFGSAAFDESYAVTVSNDGSVYTAGWTIGDLAAENAGVYDGVLAKLDNNGEVEWTRQFGTSDYEWTWGVDTDSQGNVYITGWTLGSLAGENAGSYDVFLAKYDSQGNQVWIEQFGTPGDDEAFRLNIDSNDNIFLTGYTDNSLGGPNAGSYDAWVAKYDTDGNQGWITQFGTPELDHGLGITSDNDGHLYVTGITGGSLGATNSGSFDSWLAKVNATSGMLENFSGTSKSVNASPTVDLVASDTGESVLTNPVVSDTDESVLTNPVVSDTGESVLTNPVVSDTGDSQLTNPVVSDTDESVLTNPVVSNTDDSVTTNQQIVDFIGNFFEEFIQDNNLQLYAGVVNDILNGEISQDLLSGIYGNDSIDSSDNTISGNCGDDILYGSNCSNDSIYGKAGDDTLYGGEGNNQLYGGEGDDIFYSGAGNDTLDGGKGNNLIYAGEGNNTVIADACNDEIYTGAGDDLINAGDGNNLIYVGEGTNTITTGVGDDTLYGGASNDFIYTDAGDDLIYAGEGDNIIYGGTGNNTIYGGSGYNLFVLSPDEAGNSIMNFESGKDSLGLTEGLTFEQLTITQGSNDDGFFTQISVANNNTLLATLSWVQADTITSSSFTLV